MLAAVAVAVALMAGLGLVAATSAFAHASLVATTPLDGAEVADAPQRVTLEFSEPVTAPAGGIRVHAPDGTRVDRGAPYSITPTTIAADVEPALADATYITTWRAVSVDGHTVTGAFIFGVGAAADVDAGVLAQLFAGDDEVVVGALAAAVRGAAWLGVLLAGGAVTFWWLVARSRADRTEAWRWVRWGGAIGLTATVASIPLQAMTTTGFGALQALAPAVLGDTVTTSFGAGVAVRGVALGIVLVAARRGARSVVAVAAAVALAGFVLDGHTRTVAPAWLMVTSDAVHLAAVAVWLGGLVVLGAVLRQRAASDPVAAAMTIRRFSRLATVAVVAVTLTGGAMAWATVRVGRALTTTTYGWTLLGKIGLVAVVLVLAAYNQRRLVPVITRMAGVQSDDHNAHRKRPVPAGGSTHAPPGDDRPASASTDAPPGGPRRNAADTAQSRAAVAPAAQQRLRRTVAVEIALLVGVLAVTGFLVNLRPAAEAAGVTGAFETYASLNEDLDLNLVVDPNQAGFNSVHVYVLDRTGRPASAIESVRLRLRLPDRDIGPIVREPFVAGPGHWQLDGRELSIPGRWLLEVVVAEGRFDEYRTDIPVVVNAP